MKRVYVLHGVSDRDGELVMEFFSDISGAADFAHDNPGRYRMAVLVGIEYGTFDFRHVEEG